MAQMNSESGLFPFLVPESFSSSIFPFQSPCPDPGSRNLAIVALIPIQSETHFKSVLLAHIQLQKDYPQKHFYGTILLIV